MHLSPSSSPFPPFFSSLLWKQKMRNKGTILYLRNIIGFACEAHKYSFSVSIKKKIKGKHGFSIEYFLNFSSSALKHILSVKLMFSKKWNLYFSNNHCIQAERNKRSTTFIRRHRGLHSVSVTTLFI